MTRGFKKLDGNATIPERATEHSAGYDISSSETVTIQPDEIKMVSDRKKYKQIIKVLVKMKGYVGGDEVVDKIANEWRNKYKRRKALIDEMKIL